jgi:thiol-disulfide isomerase/thioredoxin
LHDCIHLSFGKNIPAMLKFKSLHDCCWQVASVFALTLCLFGCAGNPKQMGNPAAATKASSAAPSFANDPLFQTQDDPQQLWLSLQQSFLQLDPPKSWFTNRPSPQVYADWKARKAQMALTMADEARDFYQRFPNVPEDIRAHESEYNLLEIVVNSGYTNLLPRLTNLDNAKLAAATNADDRFAIRAHIVKRDADWHLSEGVPVVMSYLESGSRELIKEFPDNPHAWDFMVTVADQEQDPDKSRALALEILDSNASEADKMQVDRILGRLNHIGKPLPFEGTDTEGHPIDLKQFRGKVVMFHFWETDCGYCLQELPAIKAIYEKYHPQGLEIISVSFDHDKNRYTQFLKKYPMPWPQYFAGNDWNETHGRFFDIQGLPNVWLVDKQGDLRFINARENLTGDVEQLLNEHK